MPERVASTRRPLELEMRPVSAETEARYLKLFPSIESIFMNEAGQLFGYTKVKTIYGWVFRLYCLHVGKQPRMERIARGNMTVHATKGILELHSFEKREDLLDKSGKPVMFKGIAAFRARAHAALRVAKPLWLGKIYLIAANERLARHYGQFGFKETPALLEHRVPGFPLKMDTGKMRLRRFSRKPKQTRKPRAR